MPQKAFQTKHKRRARTHPEMVPAINFYNSSPLQDWLAGQFAVEWMWSAVLGRPHRTSCMLQQLPGKWPGNLRELAEERGWPDPRGGCDARWCRPWGGQATIAFQQLLNS